MRHLTLVTNGFFGTAFLLGIPSLLAFFYFAANTLQLYLTKVPPLQRPASSDTLIRGIEWGAYLMGKAFSLLGAFGFYVCLLLTAATAAVVTFSVLLFFTARGIEAHQAWARIAGFCLMGILLFHSLGLFLSGARLPGLLLSAASIYSIATLWRDWT
ncbi:MAG: hypothetical protein JNK87_16360 [Bryobacterales bacterium]|nr:hypothetical protein [Bryobacterales bacterium]